LVGEILRKRREELGKDLREIAQISKIRYDYLKAIENEAFEKLPLEVYVKGYIREYAKILNIDPEVVINEYIQQTSPPQAEKREAPLEETAQRKHLRIRYVLLPFLLIIPFVFFLFSSNPKKSILPSHPHETKEENLSLVKKNHHVLEVFATDTTWLLVTIDGAQKKEILLKPGESAKWRANQNFSLKIGNAGGIKLAFDGKNLGPPGKKGQVIRLNLPEQNSTL
jgi:transcriptional regulator with XRE-family HTH domain